MDAPLFIEIPVILVKLSWGQFPMYSSKLDPSFLAIGQC